MSLPSIPEKGSHRQAVGSNAWVRARLRIDATTSSPSRPTIGGALISKTALRSTPPLHLHRCAAPPQNCPTRAFLTPSHPNRPGVRHRAFFYVRSPPMSHAATNWAIQQRGLNVPPRSCCGIFAIGTTRTSAVSRRKRSWPRTRRLPTRYILGFEKGSRKSHLRKAEMGLFKSWKKMTPHLRKQQVGPTPDFPAFHLRILPKAISGIRSMTLQGNL